MSKASGRAATQHPEPAETSGRAATNCLCQRPLIRYLWMEYSVEGGRELGMRYRVPEARYPLGRVRVFSILTSYRQTIVAVAGFLLSLAQPEER